MVKNQVLIMNAIYLRTCLYSLHNVEAVIREMICNRVYCVKKSGAINISVVDHEITN